ncbi:hypothetical protein QTP70_024751, partial [Hemibagrus guttatus]
MFCAKTQLVHPPGVRLQSTVKIFPFKFLKHLELKRIPSHCLEGLRGIYSQLEVFICSKSLNTLEELLLLCGGDLSTALPWLELHTLNFSYNYISCLDESLPLCELKHLNLAYNNLQRVPELDLNTRARLVTLVLRHNQLENINGVEHLSSLQCLDLAFNLLMEHTQLAPLAFLHNLNMCIISSKDSENLEQSLCVKGQGRKTILDARDLRALRRHCITYRNATVMEITTWAQEYFQKTLSVNTIHRAVRRCRLKLYRSKKKPYLNMIQKRRRFLWAKAHLKWTVAKWKTVLWSDESKFEVLFGKLGRHVIRTKEDKDNPSCYQRSVQKPASLMVWGCMSACGMGSLHIWKGTINAERSRYWSCCWVKDLLQSLELTLEGNPLYFQKTHRNATICHLSPRAAFRGLQLDGSTLSSTELAILPKPMQLVHQISQTHQVAIAPENIVQDMSSCGGELSDSMPTSEFGASRVYKRKSKQKVKVRTASISEPSDTEPSSSSLQDIILCHQKEIEKLDSFREQMGKDWLRYQHHLHSTSAILSGPRMDGLVAPSIADNHCTPSPTLTRTDCTVPKLDSLHVPLLSSELKREEEGIMELQLETESTLQWTDHSFVDIESTLEKSPPGQQPPEKAYTDLAFGEEEEDLGVDVCRPMLVRVLTEIEDFNKKKESEPLFLRVHQAYILEVDMHQGCVRNRFELDSLRQVTTSQFTCTEEGKERCHSVLELRFSYISHERQKRRYLMLDDDPQEALQILLELLSRIAVENERQAEKEKTAIVQLQCLKCQAEFSQPQSKNLMRALSEPDVYHEYQDKTKKEHAAGDAVFCPECTSDHVIQLAGQTSSASTPVHYGFNQNGDTCFGFDYIDTQKGESLRSPIYVRNSSEASTLPEVTTGIFLTAQCGLFKSVSSNIEDSPNHLISFHFSDSQVLSDQEESENGLAQGCSSSQRLLNHQSLQDPQRYGHDFETVDHRLQLFLDVEVFEGEEEIHCFLKMSAVKFGDPAEFPSLVVVSNQRIYILEMTSQSEGHPSEWLQKRDSHRLCELSYLEVGLGSQIIHMEFDVSAAAYTLLVRDSARCKHFYNQLEGNPILFTLFTYDCVASHKGNISLRFADDTAEIGRITGENEAAYRRELASFVTWCENNNLTLNTDKTKEMIVDMSKERRTQQPLFILELEVERVSNFKYLVFHISEDLTWTLNITQLDKKFTYQPRTGVEDAINCLLNRANTHLEEAAKARELVPKTDSKLKTISCTQLNPKHHLWPLVYEGSKTGNEVESHPPFFYLLAFLLLGDTLSSVTVLATQESLFLLDEDHQWSKSCSKLANQEAHNTSRQVTIREMQPISYVSSILLFSSDPCQVNIQLYDELAKEE